MDDSSRNATRPALAGPLLIAGSYWVLFSAYLWTSVQFPYYFIWDMDLICVLDDLLIRAGQFPDHVNHPGFGMYLIFKWVHEAARFMGLTSFGSLKDVARAGNPLLGMAELTSFLRVLSPVAVLASVTLFWIGIWRWVVEQRASTWLCLLLLAALGVREAYFYHVTMIRTELYAILFLSAAFACGSSTIFSSSMRRSAVGSVSFGACLGLAYLTKVQSFILFFWLIALFGGAGWAGIADSPVLTIRPVSRAPSEGKTSLFLLAAFLALFLAGGAFELPKGLQTFAKVYQLNIAGSVFVGLFAIPLVGWLGFKRRQAFLECTLAGVLVAFALHFLVFSAPHLAWDYLRIDVKMLFWRLNYQSTDRLDTWAALDSLRREFVYDPWLYAAQLCLFGLAFWLSESRRERLWLAGLELVLWVQLGVGTRFVLRDVLWKEIPTVLFGLVLFTQVLRRAPVSAIGGVGMRARAAPFAIALLLVIVVGGSVHAALTPARTRAHYTKYGWDATHWLTEVYRGNHRQYRQLIEERLRPPANPGLAKLAVKQSLKWFRYRNLMRATFVNARVDFRSVTVAAPGAWLAPDAQVSQVPASLQGAVLVAVPAKLKLSPRVLIWDEVTRPTETQEKFRRRPAAEGEVLALQQRPDFQIFVYSPPSASVDLGGVPGLRAEDLPLDVSRAGSLETYRAYRVLSYAEIPRAALDQLLIALVDRW